MKQVVTIRLESKVVSSLDKLASEENRSRANVIETILKKHIEDKMSEKQYTLDEMIELTGATGLGMFLDAFVGEDAKGVNSMLVLMFGQDGNDMNFAEQIAKEAETYRRFGQVDHNGDTIYLIDEATMNNVGTNGEIQYEANGIGADNTEYRVYWEPYEDYYEHKIGDNGGCAVCGEYGCKYENEEDVCDWDNPWKIEEAE